jgi:hypothetical protein
MSSLNSPFGRFQPEVVAAVEQAFEAVWATLCSDDPSRDRTDDPERMAAVSQTIAALAVEGIIDPAELRRLTLERLPLATVTPLDRNPA